MDELITNAEDRHNNSPDISAYFSNLIIRVIWGNRLVYNIMYRQRSIHVHGVDFVDLCSMCMTIYTVLLAMYLSCIDVFYYTLA